MPNRILFAGGRLDSVLAPDTNGVTEQSSATGRDTAYTDASISIAETGTGYLKVGFVDQSFAPVSVAGDASVFVHVAIHFSSAASKGNRNIIELQDAAGFPWVALRSPTGNSANTGLYYNSGTGASPVWTLLGELAAKASGLYNIDFNVLMGANGSHSASIYRNNEVWFSGSFSQPAMTNLAGCTLRNGSSGVGNDYTRFSQILCTEGISTIGAKVKYARATGAGASSDWTGSLTDVNEPVNSDTTVNTALTAGLTQTYAMGDVVVPTGYVIKGVWQWMRAKNDGVSPLNLKSVLRSGGSLFVSGNVAGMGVGMSPVGARYDVDPANGLPWTQAGWNAAEAGFQSAA